MRSPNFSEVAETSHDCVPHPAALFRDLPPESLQALQAINRACIYAKGAALFAEGTSPCAVHALYRGSVKLSVCSKEGKTLILQVAGPGELLGLSAVVTGAPYEMTAVTLEPCLTNLIRAEDFIAFLSTHGEACLRVAQHLSHNYHAACARLRSFGLSNTAAERLAKLLLDWCVTRGQETDCGVRLRVAFTHENIARMIGASRETVTRLLGEFKRRRIICVEGSDLKVLDKAALEAVARD
jgi:CRP/FNR family transcriptional regulator